MEEFRNKTEKRDDLLVVHLTHGKTTKTDDTDEIREILKQHHFIASRQRNTWYAICSYKTPRGNWSCLTLQRFILKTAPGMNIDHINGDGLDNRLCNLRLISHRANIINTAKLNKKNTSGVTGLTRPTGKDWWVAHWRDDECKRRGMIFSDRKYGGIEQSRAAAIAKLNEVKSQLHHYVEASRPN